MKQALIIVDVQNDYFTGGKMELWEMEQACLNVQHLLQHFRTGQMPVIFIQHLAVKPNASFFIPETFGCEIHESIQPNAKETIIVKHYPNSFRETNLHELLQSHKIHDLVICGAMSHMCIDTTTRAAFDLGYNCTLISDACATRDLAFDYEEVKANQVQAAFMAALNGTFATVITTDQFIINRDAFDWIDR